MFYIKVKHPRWRLYEEKNWPKFAVLEHGQNKGAYRMVPFTRCLKMIRFKNIVE